jgi:hypothetical protein
MTTAAAGVQKALARAGSSVVAIAEMTAEDLIAQMSDDQKAAVSATLTPTASAETKPKKGDCSGSDDEVESPDMNTNDHAASAADARVKAVAAAVATNDACKGKADLALSMLADEDFAGLSANALIKIVAQTPTPGSASAEVDGESAARAEMRAAIAETANSNIAANGAPAPDAAARSASVWDTARANEFRGARN